jgi:hypothetical protein
MLSERKMEKEKGKTNRGYALSKLPMLVSGCICRQNNNTPLWFNPYLQIPPFSISGRHSSVIVNLTEADTIGLIPVDFKQRALPDNRLFSHGRIHPHFEPIRFSQRGQFTIISKGSPETWETASAKEWDIIARDTQHSFIKWYSQAASFRR